MPPTGVSVAPLLRHEQFCLPRPGAIEPRIEGYVHYGDNEAGRSVGTHNVIRCVECGATIYNKIGA